jgi:DNA-binding transcriptional ArsR family regulator
LFVTAVIHIADPPTLYYIQESECKIAVKTHAPQTDFLKAISHPTRLAILEVLRDDEQCVCHVEAMPGQRQGSISQQLMILREAGLVDIRRDGLNIYYRVVKQQVFQVLDAIYSATGKPKPQAAHKHGKADLSLPEVQCSAAHSA